MFVKRFNHIFGDYEKYYEEMYEDRQTTDNE